MNSSAKPNSNSTYEKCNQMWSPDYTFKSTYGLRANHKHKLNVTILQQWHSLCLL